MLFFVSIDVIFSSVLTVIIASKTSFYIFRLQFHII